MQIIFRALALFCMLVAGGPVSAQTDVETRFDRLQEESRAKIEMYRKRGDQLRMEEMAQPSPWTDDNRFIYSAYAISLLLVIAVLNRIRHIPGKVFHKLSGVARAKLATRQLLRYKDLLDRGVISQDDFERKRTQLKPIVMG